MKNKKLLLLIPALAMVLGGCKDTESNQPGPGTDTNETVHPESVSLDETELHLDLGAEKALTATVAPVNASDTSVTWSSDHPEIVEVSSRGKLTAKAEGVAIITVKTVDGGKTAQCEVTVTKPIWGTEEEPLTVAKALETAKEKLTSANAVSSDIAYVTGYAISLTEKTGTNGAYMSNLYIADQKGETDASKKLQVYTCDYNPNKGITAVYPGDKVTVKGLITQYASNDDAPAQNWILEMTKPKNNGTVSPIIDSIVVGSSSVTLGSHENATVTDLPTAPVKHGSEFEFKVVADQGYSVATVTYNGENATKVEGKDNTYKAKVTGPTTIIVTTAAEGVTILTKEVVSPKNSTNLVDGGVNNNAALGLDGHFVVTAEQGSAKSNVGLQSEIRLYNYNDENPVDEKKGKNNTLTFSGIGITFASIIIKCTQNADYLKVTVNGQEVVGEEGVYKIDAKSFTISNSYEEGLVSTQVWIEKIVLNYSEDTRIAATAIEVSKDSVTLNVGKTERVTATVSPADSTDIVTWASNDPTIATVVEGTITAVKAGTCKVTATAGDYSKEIDVTVEDAPTFENITGKTLTPKADYFDEATGKAKTVENCVLAGYIESVANTSYGNLYLNTTDGLKVYVYGLYDITGLTRYDALETKPVAGDFIVVEGKNFNYHDNNKNTDTHEMEKAKLLQLNDTKYELPTVSTFAAVENAKVELSVGKTADVNKQLNIAPKGADTTGLTFVSGNTNIATVDAKGVVTAVAAGDTTITCSLAGFTDVVIPVKVSAEAANKYEMVFGSEGYTNSNSTDYKSLFDTTIDNIKWKVPGNQGQSYGLKIGGKLTEATVRSIYNVDKLDASVESVVVTYGSKDAAADCTGVTLKVFSSAADAAAGTNPVSTVNGTFVDQGTTTFNKPEGVTWNGGWYRLDFTITSTQSGSNRGIVITKIAFNFAA
ncbi:MAG: Ig-like domain-containing protein [Bacilli bacterium]|nr:Ig-like domain-containing protein [Bacilli bacterium]